MKNYINRLPIKQNQITSKKMNEIPPNNQITVKGNDYSVFQQFKQAIFAKNGSIISLS